jgi:adenosine deaminase
MSVVSFGEALKIAVGLPKCELHMHLDGSLLPEFLFERASARGMREVLPETSFELRNMIDSMKKEMRNQPAAGHSGVESGKNWPLFDLMNNFLQTEYELETAAYLLASHLQNVHNVKVFELRFCPTLHTIEGLSELEAVHAVGRGLLRAEAEGSKTGLFRTGIILCALRSYPSPHPMQIAQLAKSNLRNLSNNADSMVVGYDVAGSEQFPLTLPHIKEALVYCAENKVPITVHAGEIPCGTYSNLELALSLPVQRIGHGAALAFDQHPASATSTDGGDNQNVMTSQEMMERARDLGIVVEVCLTAITTPSKGIHSYQDHPIRRMLAAGVKCALSCDNLLLSGDPNTAGPVDFPSEDNQAAAGSLINGASICINGGLGVCYAHPSGEVAHLVADCGLPWAEARNVILEGARASFCFGDEGDKQSFVAMFEKELDEALSRESCYIINK